MRSGSYYVSQQAGSAEVKPMSKILKPAGKCPFCNKQVRAEVVETTSSLRRDKCRCPTCGETVYVCRMPGCNNYARSGMIWDDELCPSCYGSFFGQIETTPKAATQEPRSKNESKTSTSAITGELVKLAELKEKGALSEKEFTSAKAALLRAIQAATPPEPCPECAGSGQCIPCNGTGKVPFRDLEASSRVSKTELCSTCCGNGRCCFCQGRGKFATKK